MASLIQRSKDVRARLVDRNRQQVGQHLAQRLAATVQRSDLTVQRLGAAFELVGTLEAEDVKISKLDRRGRESAQKARTKLRTTATKLEADLDDDGVLRLLDSASFQDALTSSEALVARIATSLTKGLETERASLLPEAVGEPLPDVPGAARTLVTLLNYQRELTTPVNLTADSLSHDGVQTILEERAKRASAASEWPVLYGALTEQIEQQHPEVQLFLRVVASPSGAPLELLTDEVRSHLAQSDTFDNYRIRQL